VLLITGLPGCGKSTFVRYVRDRLGWNLLILEELPPGDALQRLWLQGLQCGTAQAFVRALHSDPRRAIVEWGFAVDDPCLAMVKSMKGHGMRVVWFECPDDVARARFVTRGTVPEAAFDAQVAAIRQNCARIMEEIEPDVVDLLNPDGSARTTEELFELVAPVARVGLTESSAS
jgi:dephospho-CoA kinase